MSRIDEIAREIAAIPLAIYGFSFIKACASASGVLLDVSAIPGVRTVFFTISALVLAIVIYRLGPQRIRERGLGIGMACFFLSILFLGIAAFNVTQSFTDGILLASIMTQSAGNVFLSALWIDLYAALNPNQAIFANSCAVIMAQCIVFFTEFNPAPRALFLLAVLAIASILAYRFARRELNCHDRYERDARLPEPHCADDAASELFPIPRKAMLFIAAYSFACGVAAPTGDVISARYATAIPSAIVIILMLISGTRFNASILFRIALPLMTGGFLLVAVVPGFSGPVSSLVLHAGYSAMELLLVLMVCAISCKTGASAIWLFSLLAATQFGTRVLGIGIGSLVSYLGVPSISAIFKIIVLTIIAMTTVSLMSEKGRFIFKELEETAEMRDESSGGASGSDCTAARLSSLIAAHDLTDRETEVFRLAMQGKTNGQIANDMFISEGTVKSHLHHIYQKFGISSRKELFSLVDDTDRK